jgi:alkylated DNA repair protein (DNA oxidative demethylase)
MQADLFQPHALPPGVAHWPAVLSAERQAQILDAVAGVMRAAKPVRPRMKNGVPMINALTNCGAWGWWSDERGYRYVGRHPETNEPWPPVPDIVERTAQEFAAGIGYADYDPDSCLVNIYAATGKLNLHTDSDEADQTQPILSFSFGATAAFVLGGLKRTDPTQTIMLRSGDAMALYGSARMRFHGVKKLYPADHILHPAIPRGGRINLTLRRAK